MVLCCLLDPSISRAGYSTGFDCCVGLRSHTSPSYGCISPGDVRMYTQLFFSLFLSFFFLSSQCILRWVVPEAHIQWSSTNIWGTHLLIHFSWQQHTEWAEDWFPPSAEPSLSNESSSALSLLGSFFLLRFYSWGIFFCSQGIFM